MSPSSVMLISMILCFPRVSGDEPFHALEVNRTTGFSPRERG